MLIEKIIGKKPADTGSKIIETVSYEWFEANNKIIKRKSSNKTDIGLRLKEPLFDGALLYEDENKIIYLELLPCELTKLQVRDAKEMGRICFELGNRHLPISIGEMSVSTPYDKPTFEYLQKLGFSCARETEKFIPEIIVYGHSH